TISDPRNAWTLEEYEKAQGITPVKRLPKDTFVNYGKWFQTRLENGLDRRNVARLCRENGGFKLHLNGGDTGTSKRIVVATGIAKFRKIPKQFGGLSAKHVSHCYDGRSFDDIGKRVAVIGAGQSAIESAALLGEAGFETELIAKIPVLRWIGMHPK